MLNRFYKILLAIVFFANASEIISSANPNSNYLNVVTADRNLQKIITDFFANEWQILGKFNIGHQLEFTDFLSFDKSSNELKINIGKNVKVDQVHYYDISSALKFGQLTRKLDIEAGILFGKLKFEGSGATGESASPYDEDKVSIRFSNQESVRNYTCNAVDCNRPIISPDGQYFVVPRVDGIYRHCLKSEAVTKIINLDDMDDERFNSLAFSKDGKYLAAGSYTGHLKIFDINNFDINNNESSKVPLIKDFDINIQDPECRKKATNDGRSIYSMVFFHNDQYVIFCDHTGTVRIISVFNNFSDDILVVDKSLPVTTAVAISEDNCYLAIGLPNGDIYIYRNTAAFIKKS